MKIEVHTVKVPGKTRLRTRLRYKLHRSWIGKKGRAMEDALRVRLHEVLLHGDREQ